MSKLRAMHPEAKVAAALTQCEGADAWLPMMASVAPKVVLLKNSAYCAIVDLDPWP
ncbi:hypothetical protein QWY82_09250 [Simiduia curdlanivorans]|uniref:Uncharacterized protein n=1 Tax=Simiduia curdlanivorans TaxID=1492769 RepID=A0ABV8V8U1_9GAMM|nr:hypothetical protein [Simiduia curdlanivorans]MDN3638991.1 hypothetical protein [Simiduia curdlanivorans]